MKVTMPDDLIKKLMGAIEEFYQYQLELSASLEQDPKAVLVELGKWNNEHQRKAASVQFFVEEFIKELGNGNYSREQGEHIASEVKKLKEQESLLFEKVKVIRGKMLEEKKRLEAGQKALTKYAYAAMKNVNTAYLSRDA